VDPGAPGSRVIGTSLLGGRVVFNGAYFGAPTFLSALQVRYGPAGDPFRYTCSPVRGCPDDMEPV
jgi:hypothetical protein